MTSSTKSTGIASTVSLQGLRRIHRRQHNDDLGHNAASTSTVPPRFRAIWIGADRGHGNASTARGQRRPPKPSAASVPSRLPGGGSRRRGFGQPGRSPTNPCRRPRRRPAPPGRSADPLAPASRADRSPRKQGRCGEVAEESRQVQGEPAITEQLSFEARRIGDDDDHQAFRAAAHSSGCRSRRPAQRGARASTRRRSPPSHLPRAAHARAHPRGFGGLPLEAARLAPASAEGIEKRAIAGTDVENRAGRGDLVDSLGEPGADSAENPIADSSEAPLGRSVPASVGLVEFSRGGPGVGGGGTAGTASDSVSQPQAAAKWGMAPGTVGSARGRNDPRKVARRPISRSQLVSASRVPGLPSASPRKPGRFRQSVNKILTDWD